MSHPQKANNVHAETHKVETVQPPQSAVANSDINFAAALRAQYAIETPKTPRRRHKKLAKESEVSEEPPLIDNTIVLPLHSKKTSRQQKRQQRRELLQTSTQQSLHTLPTEILLEIFSHLRVEDIFRLSRTTHSLRDFITLHEPTLSKTIISKRYWTLHRCFPLPYPLTSVPRDLWDGLLSSKRQDLLNIHRKSYHQHIEMIDPTAVCTCMTCVFAWNNLCLLVDLHHWQGHLNAREPIPMIPRGTTPDWNTTLLKRNADVVRLAMTRPLFYGAILEKHLATITGTILRSTRWRGKKGAITTTTTSSSTTTATTAPKPKPTTAKPRLYNMTDWDVDRGTDAFLDRKGPPSYDFPFHRDVYYSLEAYLPNRKFDDGQWRYYPLPPVQHEKDLEWVRGMQRSSLVKTDEERRTQALASLKDHNIRWSQYLEQVQRV